MQINYLRPSKIKKDPRSLWRLNIQFWNLTHNNSSFSENRISIDIITILLHLRFKHVVNSRQWNIQYRIVLFHIITLFSSYAIYYNEYISRKVLWVRRKKTFRWSFQPSFRPMSQSTSFFEICEIRIELIFLQYFQIMFLPYH